MSVVLVEGMIDSDVLNFSNRLGEVTGWPIYKPTFVNLRPDTYAIEKLAFNNRNNIVDFMVDTTCLDVVLPNFFFGLTVNGIVDAGWYAISAIRRAEKLSNRLSEIGTILVYCRRNEAPKNAYNGSDELETLRRVRESLYDLLYDSWTGEKHTSTNFERDYVINKIKY